MRVRSFTLALAGIALYGMSGASGTRLLAQPPAVQPPAAQPAPAAENQSQLAALPPIQFCGQQAAAPRAEPPANSGPVVLAFVYYTCPMLCGTSRLP